MGVEPGTLLITLDFPNVGDNKKPPDRSRGSKSLTRSLESPICGVWLRGFLVKCECPYAGPAGENTIEPLMRIASR